MTVSVSGQALSLAAGLALGLGIGLCYDLLRAVRRCLPAVGPSAALDLLFWLAVTILLFVYAQIAEGGRVRLYLALALAAGAAVYFRLFTRHVTALTARMVRLLGRFFRLIAAPFRHVRNFFKKKRIFGKKIFSSRPQWYKILSTLEADRERSPGDRKQGRARTWSKPKKRDF